VINQVKGSYDTKYKKLKPYRVVIIELLDSLVFTNDFEDVI